MAPSEYSWVYLSARVRGKHADLVRRAAEKEGTDVAKYIRNLVIPWAAADLGEGAPDMSEYADESSVQEAARRAGLSVREYEARAAKMLAARELGLEGAQRKVSEVRKKLAGSSDLGLPPSPWHLRRQSRSWPPGGDRSG
jgi:hypothetical protein